MYLRTAQCEQTTLGLAGFSDMEHLVDIASSTSIQTCLLPTFGFQDFTGLTSGEFLGFWGSARGTVGLPVSTATGLRMHGKSDGAVVVRCRAHAGRQEIRRSCKNSNSCASTYFVSRCAVNRTLRRSSSQTPSPNQRPTGSKTTSDTYGHCTHTASLQMAGTH